MHTYLGRYIGGQQAVRSYLVRSFYKCLSSAPCRGSAPALGLPAMFLLMNSTNGWCDSPGGLT